MRVDRPASLVAALRRLGRVPLCALVLLTGCEEIDRLRSTWQPVSPQEARVVPDGDATRGRLLVRQHGCINCHELPGYRAPAAHVGPPLTRFALRTNIGGSLPNQPEQLVRFVMDAPAELPGTGMPDLDITRDEASDVAAYLYTLR
jgi:cytochrome c